MKLPSSERLVAIAAVVALVALGLIVWSILQPHPIPVIVAMSVGQVLGTLSFATYLYVVVRDVLARAAKAGAARPPDGDAP
jgi:hypothetical protein